MRISRLYVLLEFNVRYMEKEVFEGFNEDVQFITPDVTQLIKLYEGRAN